MFLQYYGLREQPFGVTPDPRFLYFSATHREALASLFYGIESGCGFLALIAPPGMGKTTLLFHLLEKLRGSAQTVFLFQTQCGSREFFRYLLTDLGADATEQNMARMHESLNAVLLRNARIGRRVVLVIDEAQNLDDSVLETVRLLSDFETPQAKLLQIVLSGQPQLADKLSHPALTQLRQRISIVSRLHPFTRVETMVHIEFRLCTAGYSGSPLFNYEAAELIAAHSGGIPRNINNICFNAMTLAFAKRQKQIDASIVSEVLSDLDLEGLGSHPLAPGLFSGNSLTTFDGISPTDEGSYHDFHTAVRSAWGKGHDINPPAETPASDQGAVKPGNGNHSLKSIFQTPDGSEALSGSPFELEGGSQKPFADAAAHSADASKNGSSKRDLGEGEADLTSAAISEGARIPTDPSLSEPQPPPDENGLSGLEFSFDLQPNGNGTTGAHGDSRNGVALTRSNASPSDSGKAKTPNSMARWGQAISKFWQNGRKKEGVTEAKKRLLGAPTLFVAALALGTGGIYMAGRSYDAPKSQIDNGSTGSTSDQFAPTAASEPEKAVKSDAKRVSELPQALSGDNSSVITLESGQTLSEVSLRYLGKFNDDVTQQIQKLNPEIKNPDVVYAGTQVRLPTPPGALDRSASNTEPDPSSEEHSR